MSIEKIKTDIPNKEITEAKFDKNGVMTDNNSAKDSYGKIIYVNNTVYFSPRKGVREQLI